MLLKSSVSFVGQSVQGYSLVIPLVKNLQTYPTASNSVILSTSAYICWKYAHLKHPHYFDKSFQFIPQSGITHQHENLSLHPLFEGWCDTICEAIFNDDAVEQENELFVFIRVSEQYLEYLEEFGLNAEVFEGPPVHQKVFNLSKIENNKKKNKIALMNFATSQLRQNQLLPKINLPSLLLGTVFANQKWDYYKILKGQIPSKETLAEYTHIILPGSSHSANDQVPQIQEFGKELKQALLINPNLKILSICFGHQLISKLFETNVVKKDKKQGQQKVKFRISIARKHSFLKQMGNFKHGDWLMPEHHEDYIEQIPEQFELLGKSESCQVEAMVKKDGKILSFQFHPEYLADYALSFQNRMKQLCHQKYQMSFNLSISQEHKEKHLQSCDNVRKCIQKFLK